MQQIGRYQIRSEAGRGGMSTVYEAFDPHFQRSVAVKVMTRDLLEDPKLKARFTREAQTIAALEHPAIVPVYDFGEDDKRPYLVMRLMTGGSLAERLNDGPLSVSESARILKRIGSALDRAHAQGIIHRDLKPSNIMFDQYGDAFLADFGIARVTEGALNLTGENVIGTPAYMSPEQIHGDQTIDGRSDIYALGVICFEMLTGQKPYQEKSAAKIMMQHLIDPVPDIRQVRPDLPPGMEEIIARSMAKSPNDRYGGAAELTDTLDSLAQIKPIAPPPAPSVEVSAAAVSAAAVSAAATPSLTPDEADDVEVTLPDSAELAAQRAAPAPVSAPAVDAQPAAAGDGPGRSRKWIGAAVLAGLVLVIVLGVVFFRDSFPFGGNETAEINGETVEPETGEAASSDDAEAKEPQEPEDPDLLPMVEAHMNRFFAAMDEEDYEKADLAVHEAIALMPEQAWLYNELAWLRETTDDLDGALMALDEAVSLEPDNAEFHARIGNIFREKGELDTALAHQMQAVELDPQNPYFHIDMADTFQELDDLEMALDQYNQAIALEDQEAWFYDSRAHVLFHLGDYDLGLADLERAAELEPGDRSFFRQAGEIFLHDLEDPQRALEYFNMAVEQTPEDAWVYADRAQAHSALENVDAALADLNKAIELDPQVNEFYIKRSELYQYYLDDPDAALADLNRAVEVNPQDPEPFAKRANFFQYTTGDLQAALEDQNHALALDPEAPWRYSDRAFVYRDLGQIDEAIADFTHCLELDPQYYWCVWERGLLFRDSERSDEAMADFQHYLELAPEDDCPECRAEAELFIRENS